MVIAYVVNSYCMNWSVQVSWILLLVVDLKLEGFFV